MQPVLDDQDRKIIAERVSRRDKHQGPRVGDWVDFADGQQLRIGQVHPDYKEFPGRVQLTLKGGFHLGPGLLGFSGHLTKAVPIAELTETDRTRYSTVWIFHHDKVEPAQIVHAQIPLRVFTCPLHSPKI